MKIFGLHHSKGLKAYWTNELCSKKITKNWFLLGLLFLSFSMQGQVVINELQEEGTVELKNLGSEEQDVSGYWLCNSGTYEMVGNLNVFCGNAVLQPGEIMTVDDFPGVDPADGEMALYTSPDFGSSIAMIDYVQWGSAGHLREDVAVMSSIWTAGDFVPSFVGSQSLEFGGGGNTSAFWVSVDESSICENNATCVLDGGTIETDDATTICVDGSPDPINVLVEGAFGPTNAWVITDAETGTILGLPTGPPFDLDGAGGGACNIYFLSYQIDLLGLEAGQNIADLDGCFSLSNAILVTRNAPSGGTISTEDPTSICVDGTPDPIDVLISDASGPNQAWVITDADNNILAVPTAPPFDLDGAGVGTCLIYNLSYEDGITGLENGNNLADIVGCFGLSNSIAVQRNDPPEAQTIETDNPTTICIDGNSTPIAVTATGGLAANFGWVITDAASGTILGVPPGPPFDLEGAGGGVCNIYSIAYQGDLFGLTVGNNLSDVGGCFALSNEIAITRNFANPGTISTDDPTSICVDGVADPIDVTISGADAPNMSWVITDHNTGEILGLPMAPPFDLDGAGLGVCAIYNLAYEDGLTGLDAGQNIADLAGCFNLSNPIIVTRNEAQEGGMISTTDPTLICVDGTPDPIDVSLSGASGTNGGWIITDAASGTILGLPAGPPFDLDGAGEGTCSIYYISYGDGVTGIEAGGNINNISGCFDLSNAIDVVRQEVSVGSIGVIGETDICLDGNADMIKVFTHPTTVVGLNNWVITDDNDVILNITSTNTYDLETFGPGVCRIYRIAYSETVTGLEIGSNINDLAGGCFESSGFITVTRTESPEGGTISTNDPTDICVDGNADPINVALDGNTGPNGGWVITGSVGEILGLPAGPPFDLDGAGPGACVIYWISYANNLEGLEMGNNLSDLTGCFDLSNGIVVNRSEVNAGQIGVVGDTEICLDGNPDPIKVFGTNTSGLKNWVITDDSNNILNITSVQDYDLENFGPGVCFIYRIAYSEGLEGLEAGNSLEALNGCFDLSNAITVTRYDAPVAATISTDDPTTICVDGNPDPIDVTATGMTGQNNAWVITDVASGRILGLPAGPPFDLDGAGFGTCAIYHLSYNEEITGLTVGKKISRLEGCFSLSNAIEVVRNAPKGGLIGPMQDVEIIVDGTPDPLDLFVVSTRGETKQWVITDSDSNILGLPAGPPFDLDGAGVGVCLIWHISYYGDITGLEMGLNLANLDGCFDLSTNAIQVTRNEPGANLNIIDSGINNNSSFDSNAELSSESVTNLTIFPNPSSDVINVSYEGLAGENGELIIADATGQTIQTHLLRNHTDRLTLQVNDMPQGIYIMRVISEGRITAKRLVVTK